MWSAVAKPSREPLIVIALLVCGALGRLLIPSGTTTPFRFESYYVAASLVTTGRFADPFGYPSGPTAHVGMLTPLPSALAYWLFGVGSPRAEYILSIWAVFLVCLSIWLCWRLAVVLDVPRGARAAAAIHRHRDTPAELGVSSDDCGSDLDTGEAGGSPRQRSDPRMAGFDGRRSRLSFHLEPACWFGCDRFLCVVSPAADPSSAMVDCANLNPCGGRPARRGRGP